MQGRDWERMTAGYSLDRVSDEMGSGEWRKQQQQQVGDFVLSACLLVCSLCFALYRVQSTDSTEGVSCKVLKGKGIFTHHPHRQKEHRVRKESASLTW